MRKLVAKYLDRLEIRAERLVFLDKDKSVRDNNGVRFYVPVFNRRKILRLAHSAPHAAHMGIQKTLDRLNHAWWPGMRKDVEWLIKCCNRCQRNKLIHNLDGEMLIPEPHGVWSKVHVDLNGPLPVTARDNKYILIVVDSASKFTVLIPLPDKTAYTVARKLLDHVCYPYGIPHEIVSDGGKEFVNGILKELAVRLGVELHTTTPYHQQSNGIAEVKGKTVLNILRAICKPDQSDWDLCLLTAQFAINTFHPRGIQFSPYFLMFGREPYTPVDICIKAIPQSKNILQWWTDLAKARELAAANEYRVRLEPKEAHDSKIRQIEYKLGELVLVRFDKTDPSKSRKLSARYQGPYKIVKISKSGQSLTLTHFELDSTIERHVSEVKPFKQEEEGRIESEDEYEVERIVEEKEEEGTRYYRVRFYLLPPENDRWMTEDQLVNAPKILEEWKSENSLVPKPLLKNDMVFIEKILSHKKQGNTNIFTVIRSDDFGPDDTVEVTKSQILNQEIVEKYLKENKKKRQVDSRVHDHSTVDKTVGVVRRSARTKKPNPKYNNGENSLAGGGVGEKET